MKHSLPLTLLLGLIVSCGRTSDLDGDDGAGSGGNGNGATSSGGTGDATTGGTASIGGSTSAGATGGSATHTTGGSPSDGGNGGAATGGEAALGGMGGEAGLPLCEDPGYPVPSITPRFRIVNASWEGIDYLAGEQAYEGPVVTGPVDDIQATFEWPESAAQFHIQADFSRPGPLVDPNFLQQLFTEGEELYIRFQASNYFPLFAQLRRLDGSLVAFIHTGVFQPDLIASLDLPIPWSLEPWCRHDGSTSATEALALHTHVDAQSFELSTYEEQTLEVEGRPFLLTVHYAALLGGCASENCSLIERAGGPNLDAQLIALD